MNVPLKSGISDSQYLYVFKSVVNIVIGKFSPDVIVLQSGADSLGGD